MRIRQLSCAALLVALSTPAFAGEFYVVGAVGRSQYLDIENRIRYNEQLWANKGAVNPSLTLTEYSSAFKFLAGYQFNPYFAVEGSYTDLGQYTGDMSYDGGKVHSDIDVKAVGLAVLGLVPVSNSITGFIKLGRINDKTTVTGWANDTNTGQSVPLTDSLSRWSTVAGAGGIYKLSRNVDLRFEYERFHNLMKTNTNQEGVWSRIRAELLSLGVGFRF